MRGNGSLVSCNGRSRRESHKPKAGNLDHTANVVVVLLLLKGAFLASAEAVMAYQNALGTAVLLLVGITVGGLLLVGAVPFLWAEPRSQVLES